MAGRVLALIVLGVASAGCGIDEVGLATADASPATDAPSPIDAPSDSPRDAPLDVPADAPTPVEAGPCDVDGNDCQSPDVPLGWSPVAYVESPQGSCPALWSTPDDYVTNVANGTASCACDCSMTAAPSCTTGTTQTYASFNSGCGTQGVALTFTNGGCVSLNGNLSNYYSSTPIAPFGGTCSVQPASSGSLQTTPARLCIPDSTCQSAACGGVAPNGFAACIVADGDQNCPLGSSFTQKHAIAKSAAASCANTCGAGCTFQGSCTTPQLNTFSNGGCNNPLVALASDGTCVATGHGGSNVQSASYSATASFTGCTATGSTALKVDLSNQRTVCCRP